MIEKVFLIGGALKWIDMKRNRKQKKNTETVGFTIKLYQRDMLLI